MLVFIFIKHYDFWIKHGINNIVEPNIVWFSISSHCISEFSPIRFPSFLLRTMIFLFHIAWFSIFSQHFLMENTPLCGWFLPRCFLSWSSSPYVQVLDIVAGYFTELPLQSHLQILANSIASRDLGESGAREGKGRWRRGMVPSSWANFFFGGIYGTWKIT